MARTANIFYQIRQFQKTVNYYKNVYESLKIAAMVTTDFEDYWVDIIRMAFIKYVLMNACKYVNAVLI